MPLPTSPVSRNDPSPAPIPESTGVDKAPKPIAGAKAGSPKLNRNGSIFTSIFVVV